MISVVMVGGTPENDLVVNTIFGLPPGGRETVGAVSVRYTDSGIPTVNRPIGLTIGKDRKNPITSISGHTRFVAFLKF